MCEHGVRAVAAALLLLLPKPLAHPSSEESVPRHIGHCGRSGSSAEAAAVVVVASECSTLLLSRQPAPAIPLRWTLTPASTTPSSRSQPLWRFRFGARSSCCFCRRRCRSSCANRRRSSSHHSGMELPPLPTRRMPTLLMHSSRAPGRLPRWCVPTQPAFLATLRFLVLLSTVFTSAFLALAVVFTADSDRVEPLIAFPAVQLRDASSCLGKVNEDAEEATGGCGCVRGAVLALRLRPTGQRVVRDSEVRLLPRQASPPEPRSVAQHADCSSTPLV